MVNMRLIIYDDLSKQAVAYRQMSLISPSVHLVVKHIQEMFSTYILVLLERASKLND